MTTSLLEITNLVAGYGSVEILHGVSMSVAPGEIVALIGANGAGKSTLLNSVSGFVSVRSGDIRFNGRSVVGQRPASIARMGLLQVPEGRRVFPQLSVMDNLCLGGYGRSRHAFAEHLQDITRMFPRLLERRAQPAGSLSGGEQQMLAIGRALAAGPRLLMLDEPSIGLAPMMVAQLFGLIRRLRDEFGTGVLLVEQNARAALRIADRAHVLALGEIKLSGAGADLLTNPVVIDAFLGGLPR